jgi:hypothetical protein
LVRSYLDCTVTTNKMSLLPMVPFVMLPRKRWEPRQEKKNRPELIDDSPAQDEESIIPDNVSVKSGTYIYTDTYVCVCTYTCV